MAKIDPQARKIIKPLIKFNLYKYLIMIIVSVILSMAVYYFKIQKISLNFLILVFVLFLVLLFIFYKLIVRFYNEISKK